MNARTSSITDIPHYVGGTRFAGTSSRSQGDIIDFALKYDPQPFHLDDEAAKNTFFGRLSASGWHTGAMAMRMMVDHYISPLASMGSPGIDEVRWTMPVRPGDTLHSEVIVESVTLSRSKPDRGVAKLKFQVVNQRSEEVASYYLNLMLKSRSVLA